jgi:hypothetical protein
MIGAGGKPCWVAAAPPAAGRDGPVTSGPLTAEERERYPKAPDRLLRSIDRVFLRLAAAPVPPGA